MSRKRLHYGSVPNMAGMYIEAGLSVPAAPPFEPDTLEDAAADEAGPARLDTRAENPATIAPPVQPLAGLMPMPPATTFPRQEMSPPTRSARKASEPARPEYAPARPAPRLPVSPRAMPKPQPVAIRPKAKRATEKKPDSTGRIRRTIRFPVEFDVKLAELARARGVNINSAVLAAITGEWQREFVRRDRG